MESPPLFFKSPLVSTSSPQETFQSPPLITNRSKLPHSIFRQNQTILPKNKRTIIFLPHTPHPQPQTKDTNRKGTTTYSKQQKPKQRNNLTKQSSISTQRPTPPRLLTSQPTTSRLSTCNPHKHPSGFSQPQFIHIQLCILCRNNYFCI